MRSTRFEMNGSNVKLCRTHLVGDIEWWKASCYILICNRCGFQEGIGSWYVEMWKVKGRYVWSKKQWPFIFAAIQMLELAKNPHLRKKSYLNQYYTKEEQNSRMKEYREYWHKWIEENIK